MAIKLVRKHVEEVVNTPIKLNDNLFIKVRDLSNETDMTVEELVNYFIEEALLQVEFDDENYIEDVEAKEEVIEGNVKTIEEDSLDIVSRYKAFLENALTAGLGNGWKTDGKTRNTVNACVKSRLDVANVKEIAELYNEHPKVVEDAVNHAIRLRIADKNKKPKANPNLSEEAKEFYAYLDRKIIDSVGDENLISYRRKVAHAIGNRTQSRTMEEVFQIYKLKPDIIKRYVQHYLDLAISGNKRGGNVKELSLPIIDISSPVKKVIKPSGSSTKETKKEPTLIVVPNTDDRDKMLSKLKFEAGKIDDRFNFNACLSNVYRKMKKVYGYDLNEEKKNYYSMYQIHPNSTLEVIKGIDELWKIFWNLMQDESGVDYSKIA